jgi:hypothetical protein
MSPYVLSLCALRLSEFLGISTRGAPLALPSFAVGSGPLGVPQQAFLIRTEGLDTTLGYWGRGLQGGPYGASLISNDSLAYVAALYP